MAESVEVNGGENPPPRRGRVTNQASMAGVRAREELGGGTAAWIQLETGFPPDEATTVFANRNSAVGLTGAWGTIMAGRWDSVFEQSQVGIIDPFSDQGLPDITGAAVNQGNFARRAQNIVQYWSPSWRGFQAKASYSANEGRTASANPWDLAASLTYNQGTLYAGLAVERHHDQVGSIATAGINETGYGLASSYRMGPFKLEGQLGRYRRSGYVTQRSYALGLEAALGRGVVLAIYQDSRGGALEGAQQPSCDLLGVGYKHVFSARTFLIVEYARVRNPVGALCNFGSNAVPITAGQGLQGIGAGVRTLF